MNTWLYGQTVILTGASGGIGRELTKILIDTYGASVVGVGRSEEKMRSLLTELGENARRFSYKCFDVSDEGAWTRLANELKDNGVTPSLLVNNAGAFPTFSSVKNTSAETVERIVRINYAAPIYAVNALSDAFGSTLSIVNIASSAALCTVVGTAPYSASKAALKAYTEALQMEERNRYIGIMYPGTTKTELFRDDKNTENSALDLVAMPASKMAKKIAKKIVKRRKRAVLGWDAKLMNLTAKLMPVKGLALIAWVMKKSRSKVFANVFEE